MAKKEFDQGRRSLLLSATGGIAMAASASIAPGLVAGESQKKQQRWDREVDIVCVGSGAAALAAAVTAQANGNEVLVLEKGPITGGTTRKSGGVFWIPNHFWLREQGKKDAKKDCMQYLCRMSYPERYHPDSSTMGLDKEAYVLLEAFYDNGYRMVDLLRDRGALRISPFNMWHLNRPEPDYQNHLEENKLDRGRSLAVLKEDGGFGNGVDFIEQLVAYLQSQGTDVLTDHPVRKLVQNDRGDVIGVEVETYDGTIRIRGRKAVIFGSGGYPHNLDYIRYYQRTFLYGSCATPLATGDFIGIASSVGARLGNLHSAWRSQVLIEEAMVNRSVARCVDMPPGDSMFMVNKRGVRVVNEKRNYNDRTEVHLSYDPNNGEFPNQLLFIIYDQRTAELYAGSHPLPSVPDGADYVIRGASLRELADNIHARLDTLRPHIGSLQLSEGFSGNLNKTFLKFNEYAASGVDPEFNRGSTDYDREWALFFQPARSDTSWPVETNKPNPAMYPLQADGPYYALIVGAGALDTNGGPVVDENARVLDIQGKPIPGLYGAGNCVASPTRNAYVGAGGTIGPAMTFGYIAAMNTHNEPVKEV